jgi:restriction endonuclease
LYHQTLNKYRQLENELNGHIARNFQNIFAQIIDSVNDILVAAWATLRQMAGSLTAES